MAQWALSELSTGSADRSLRRNSPACSRCCLKIHIFLYRMGTRWGGYRHQMYTHNSSISSWALSYLLVVSGFWPLASCSWLRGSDCSRENHCMNACSHKKEQVSPCLQLACNQLPEARNQKPEAFVSSSILRNPLTGSAWPIHDRS